MNLIGKIFTILIAVMCLVFMTLAMMVYATHKNWMLVVNNPPATATLEKPLGLSQQLSEARKLNDQLTQDNEQINRALDKEKADERQTRAKLETENDRLQKLDERQRTQILEKDKAVRDAVAAMDAAHKTLASLRAENEVLRVDIQAARTDRDKTQKELVAKTDKLHNAIDELVQLKERARELAAEFAKANEALRYFKINYKSDYKSKEPPTDTHAIILGVTDKVVEISIGADDGLRKGHKLEVTRGGKYVGRIQVTQTTPDRSVGLIIPDMLQSPMQRGDRVADRID